MSPHIAKCPPGEGEARSPPFEKPYSRAWQVRVLASKKKFFWTKSWITPSRVGDLTRTSMLFYRMVLGIWNGICIRKFRNSCSLMVFLCWIPHNGFPTEVPAIVESTGPGVGSVAWGPGSTQSDAASAATALASHASAVRQEAWLASNFIFQLKKYDCPGSSILRPGFL